MKLLLLGALLLAGGTVSACACACAATTDMDLARTMARIAEPDGRVVVVAHRGCHRAAPGHQLGAAPENSAAALQACVRLGVDVMETDVRRTRDGYLVIMHDASVDRTTDGHGELSRMTLEQVKALRLRQEFGGPDAAITQERVPTLDEMLHAASGRIVLNLDIKDPIYAEVAEAVRRQGAAGGVIIKTAAGMGSVPLAGIAPYDQAPFMPVLVASDEQGSDLAQVLQRQASASRQPLGYELPVMDAAQLPAVAAAAAKVHRRVWVNTLEPGFVRGMGADAEALRDPAAVWGRLYQQGVTIIQTDEPEALIAYFGGH